MSTCKIKVTGDRAHCEMCGMHWSADNFYPLHCERKPPDPASMGAAIIMLAAFAGWIAALLFGLGVLF